MIWYLILAVVLLFVSLLVAQTVHRVVFPWDRLVWQETCFQVNLMKLNSHLPVQTAPQDCNSIIYSPGDEYLTYLILRPFGLALDLRWYRVVNTLFCLLAAALGALTVGRFLGAAAPVARKPFFLAATGGILWLLLSQNFESDMPHADNLHALHAALVFFLSYAAVETRRFRFGVLAMVVAGVGVFTKQTEGASWLGPGLAFLILNPWGWRRALALLAVGSTVFAISLYLLWLPQYGKFYTFTLLAHDHLEFFRTGKLALFLFSDWRAALLTLAVIGGASLWTWGAAARRYLICWSLTGCFTAAPGLVSYLKVLAIWNNLILLEFWLMLLAWPVIAVLLSQWDDDQPRFAPFQMGASRLWRSLSPALICLFALLLVLLHPAKAIPRPVDYAFCQAVDAEVQAEIRAGHRILVSLGAGFYVRAGVTTPPLDQALSAVELSVAGRGDLLSEFRSRLTHHYYDKIFLMGGHYYGTNVADELIHNYKRQSVIVCSSTNRISAVMTDCYILVPQESPTQTLKASEMTNPASLPDPRGNETGFQPSWILGMPSWGVAPGWYEAAPLALIQRVTGGAKSAVPEGQRPAAIPAQANGLGSGTLHAGEGHRPDPSWYAITNYSKIPNN